MNDPNAEKQEVFEETLRYLNEAPLETTLTLQDVYQHMETNACGRSIYSQKRFRDLLKLEYGETLQFTSSEHIVL